MRRSIAIVFFLCTAIPVPAQERPDPSQVRRTVAALVGTWSGRMTAVGQDDPPETFPWTMECKEIALGAGVSCTMSGKSSTGPVAQSCLVAFDPVAKAVHAMCVTSMGEVHDHDGQWVDDRTIEFSPLAGTIMDEPTLKTMRWTFPDARTIETRTLITLADGEFVRFDFVGHRQG